MTVPRRNLRDVGYFLVGETFLVSQRQDLTEFRRQFIHCFSNQFRVFTMLQNRRGTQQTRRSAACISSSKVCGEINRPVLFEQRVGGISDNRQQPGAAVGTMESTERFERSKICLLNHIATHPLRCGAAIWPNCARRRDEAASPLQKSLNLLSAGWLASRCLTTANFTIL